MLDSSYPHLDRCGMAWHAKDQVIHSTLIGDLMHLGKYLLCDFPTRGETSSHIRIAKVIKREKKSTAEGCGDVCMYVHEIRIVFFIYRPKYWITAENRCGPL